MPVTQHLVGESAVYNGGMSANDEPTTSPGLAWDPGMSDMFDSPGSLGAYGPGTIPGDAPQVSSIPESTSQNGVSMLHGTTMNNGTNTAIELSLDVESDGDDSDDDDDNDIVASLSTRMGSLRIAEDGQLRYYGPTSNLHVHPNGSQSVSQSRIRKVADDGKEALRRLGLDHEVSLPLEIHLAKLYFSWEDPAIHVVDEEAFFNEKMRYVAGYHGSPYYSETLNNAM